MKVAAKLEYEKLRQIGVGQGMNSTVFLANDPQLGGEIVVKEVPITKFRNTVAAYFEEAHAMFAANHANVVPVLYAGTTATDICIAMPHYSKGSLADLLTTGPLTVADVVRLGQDVLAGLAHIHIAGYVHFDVKPSNVLLSHTRRGLIADFGQSRAIGPGGTISVPSLYWSCVPPEAYRGTVTLLADVYQAGLLLYRAVNGEADWNAQVAASAAKIDDLIKRGRFPNRKRFLPHVPDRLRRVIRKALSIDPKGRFQSATEFADDLGQVAPPLNWRCSPAGSGTMSWRADRAGQPALIVELLPNAASWDVQLFTDGSTRRAKDKATVWRSNLTLDDAERHLREVFKSLS